MADTRKLLTVSECRCYQACPRKHHFQYDQLYRPVESAESLRFGTLVHKGLEAWWSAVGVPLDAAFAAMHQGDTDDVSLVLAEELLRLYDMRWGNEPYETLAVEAEFTAELRNPDTGAASRTWRVGGKIDAICRDLRDDRVLIVEHKTSSEDIGPGSEYWRRLQLDNQVSTYFVGARSLGHDPAACLYDVIGKPRLKPLVATPLAERKYKKDGTLYAAQREHDETLDAFRARVREKLQEDPSHWLQRGEVNRLEGEEKDAAFDLWGIARQIREGELAERFPRNPSSCLSYGRTCPFFDVCTGVASLDDPLRFVRVESAHPELGEKNDKE